MLQGVPCPPIGAGGACGLGGGSSSRFRQVHASGGCWFGSEVLPSIGEVKGLVALWRGCSQASGVPGGWKNSEGWDVPLGLEYSTH